MSDELSRAIDQRDRLARAIEEALRLAERAPTRLAWEYLAQIVGVLRNAPLVILSDAAQVSDAQASAAVLRHALRVILELLPKGSVATSHILIREVAEKALLDAPSGRRLIEAAYAAREALDPLVHAATRGARPRPDTYRMISVSDEHLDLAVEAAGVLPARPRAAGGGEG